MKRYFIWGMGLLGASLAIDLKKKGHHVSGSVRSQKNKETLLAMGFKEVFTLNEKEMWQSIKNSDGIIIGTPVEYIYNIIEQLNEQKVPSNIWITDMASTKGDLMRWVDNYPATMRFVGSHPMAGSDLNGPEHAHENLFAGATIYVTPSATMRQKLGNESYDNTTEEIKLFWNAIGAKSYSISHLVHDRWAAYLSHGLHLVSCMVSYLLNDIPDVFEVESPPAGGSFRDITRVAGSNPELWDGIIGSNSEEVVKYLESMEKLIGEWKNQLKEGTLPIREIFENSAKIRSKIIKRKTI